MFFFFNLAQHCTNPKITDVQTFTTQDSKVNTETAYIVQFRVQCANNAKVEHLSFAISVICFVFIFFDK
jgi:hypothetical protein